jgi:toxin secretion/phage lysis holin
MMDSFAATSAEKLKLSLAPGVALAYFLGVHPLLIGLAAFQLLDAFTGVLASVSTGHKLTSALASAGMRKKTMMWVYVLMAHLLETLSGSPLGFPVAAAVAALWICVEAISICENGAKMGVPPPPPIRWAIVKFKGMYDEQSGRITGTGEVVATQPPKDPLQM